MEGTIISFINMKGGVGKTTLSIGVADYLSSIGHSILLIDADPQFNATQALLDSYKNKKAAIESSEDYDFYNDEILSVNKTVFRLFMPQTNVNKSFETPSASELITSLKENLDILCGDLNLVLVNSSNNHAFINRIRNFIDYNGLRTQYDYIIIDCPPTLTIYTDSALMASDYYLIPNKIDRYSIVGIDSLQRAVNNLIREERINLKCIGLVYTMVNSNMPAKQEKIRLSFENKKIVSSLDIFSSRLTIVNNIQYGVSGTIPTRYKSSKEDIEAISIELMDKINILKREGN